MTRGTRFFLFGSVATLVLGLAVGLAAYYTGFPLGALSRSGAPEELRYMPKDATLLAYANVRDVMNSELRQRLRALEPEGQRNGQREFQERTGINIEADVDRVVACMTSGEADEDHGDGMVLARGRFDEVRLEGLAREHGGNVEQYKGKRMMTHHAEFADGGDMAMAFLEAGLVALGSDRLVRGAIDLAGGGENVTANDDLMRLVGEMDAGNAWAVGRFDALAKRARLPEGVKQQLPPINWFAAEGHVNGGLSGVLKAEARDEAAANNLRDVVRGFMALAKLQTSAKPELQALMQALELGGTGTTVSLAFSVPAEIFDAMAVKGAPNPQKH